MAENIVTSKDPERQAMEQNEFQKKGFEHLLSLSSVELQKLWLSVRGSKISADDFLTELGKKLSEPGQ